MDKEGTRQLWIAEGRYQHDVSSGRGAYQDRWSDLERTNERLEVIGIRIQRNAHTRVGPGRGAEIAAVDRDEPIALGHSFALGLPVPVIRDRAMHEDYRRAAPLLHVPDSRAVDRCFLERGLIEWPLQQRSMSGDQDGGSGNQCNDLHSVLLYSTRSDAAALRCLTTELSRAMKWRQLE